MKKKKKVIVIQCSSKYFCSWLWSGTMHLEINTSGHEVLKSEKEKRKKECLRTVKMAHSLKVKL